MLWLRRGDLAVLLALTIYVPAASLAGYRNRDFLHGDVICYLRYAMYLAEGRFADSVSGAFSPLISWCTAPLLIAGVDPCYAIRIVLWFWGLLFVLATARGARILVRRRLFAALALSVIAVEAAGFSAHYTSGDLPMSACLLGYCAIALSPHFPKSRRRQFLAGVVAGVAYLGKSYAFPFFLVHFPVAVGLRVGVRSRPQRWRYAAIAWALGMTGFLLVSAPWVAVLTAKYGRLTFSSLTVLAGDLSGGLVRDFRYELFNVPEGRITVFETWEDCMKFTDVERPFGDRVRDAVRRGFWNAVLIRESILGYDLLALSIPGVVVSLLLAPSAKRRRQAVFLAATVAIFVSGFLLIYWENRYTRAVFYPLLSLWCFGVAAEWLRRLQGTTTIPRWTRYAAASLLLLSYLLPTVYLYSKEPLYSRVGRNTREVAAQLKTVGCAGPIAILPNESLTYHYGLCSAFHLGLQYAGGVKGTDIHQIEKELAHYGVETLLLDPGDPRGNWFLNGTSWTLKALLIGRKGMPNLGVWVAPKSRAESRGRE